MTEYVLDAHALVWMLEGNPRLGLAARAVLSDPTSSLILPVTALAEACWVVSKGARLWPTGVELSSLWRLTRECRSSNSTWQLSSRRCRFLFSWKCTMVKSWRQHWSSQIMAGMCAY